MEDPGNVQRTLSWTRASRAAFDIYIVLAAHPRPFCSVTEWKANDLFWRIMLERECAWFTWNDDLEKKFYNSIPYWKLSAWDKAFRVLIGAEKIPYLWTQTLNTLAQNSKEEEKLEH